MPPSGRMTAKFPELEGLSPKASPTGQAGAVRAAPAEGTLSWAAGSQHLPLLPPAEYREVVGVGERNQF